MLDAVAQIKELQIPEAVKALDDEDVEVLMGLLYDGWEVNRSSRHNALLFTWHAELVKRAGEGCVVRALFRPKVSQ
jgi:hypothetical protein